MKKAAFSFATALLLSTFAFANTPTSSSAQKLTFDDLKTACQNPAAYHNQIAPANIQVSCVDIQTKWVADPAATMQQPNSRLITSSVTSDKYAVDAVTDQLQMPVQAVSCNRYKEVSERTETVRAVTCADLIAFKGTAKDFCTSCSDTMRGSNPAAIQATDTGKVLDLCSGTASSSSSAATPAYEY